MESFRISETMVGSFRFLKTAPSGCFLSSKYQSERKGEETDVKAELHQHGEPHHHGFSAISQHQESIFRHAEPLQPAQYRPQVYR